MALAIGLLLILLGLVALVAWSSAVVVFLKGLVAFSLVFWGALSLVVGVAKLKSKREREAAFRDAPSELESRSEQLSDEDS